jgi:hypothetical protein
MERKFSIVKRSNTFISFLKIVSIGIEKIPINHPKIHNYTYIKVSHVFSVKRLLDIKGA